MFRDVDVSVNRKPKDEPEQDPVKVGMIQDAILRTLEFKGMTIMEVTRDVNPPMNYKTLFYFLKGKQCIQSDRLTQVLEHLGIKLLTPVPEKKTRPTKS